MLTEPDVGQCVAEKRFKTGFGFGAVVFRFPLQASPRVKKKKMCVERRLLSDISEPARARLAQNLRCALQGGGPTNSSGIMISSDETGGARVVWISTLDRSPLLGMCVESIS